MGHIYGTMQGLTQDLWNLPKTNFWLLPGSYSVLPTQSSSGMSYSSPSFCVQEDSDSSCGLCRKAAPDASRARFKPMFLPSAGRWG